MDPNLFKALTEPLLKYNRKLERWELADNNKPKACGHCERKVCGQLIVCEPHKLGTKHQHFKHKCMTCRMIVYDGSYVKEPHTLRPFSNYIPKNLLTIGTPSGPKLTKNGKIAGRPRTRVELPIGPKRKVGRPRKNPVN